MALRVPRGEKRSAQSHAKNRPHANVTPIARVTAKSVNASIPNPAKEVRNAKNTVRRTPGAKDEFFHLNKILVYGRKLY